jgi:WD40 repeat protein
MIAFGNGGGEVNLYSITDHSIRRILLSDSDARCAVFLSSDAKYLLVAGANSLLGGATSTSLWNLAKGEPIWCVAQSQPGDLLNPIRASFAPDFSSLVMARNNGEVVLHDIVTGTRIAELQRGGDVSVGNLEYAPSGDAILVIKSGSAPSGIWNIGKRTYSVIFDGRLVGDFACYSHDGSRVACNSVDGRIVVFDAHTCKVLTKSRDDLHACVSKVLFSPDDQRILSICSGPENKELGYADNLARLWDSSTGKHLFAFTGHTAPVNDCGFSQDGKRVFTCSDDGSIRVWDANDGETISVLRRETPVVKLIACDSAMAVALHENGQIVIWERIRPERWWGIVCLPYSWCALMFSIALAWSLISDRRRFRTKPASVQPEPSDGEKPATEHA